MQQPRSLRPGTFDLIALQAALDAERRARDLTWAQTAAEMAAPFRGTASIPISVSTLSRMAQKHSVTSAVVLQVLRWIDRTPESFCIGCDGLARDEERLPDIGPSRVLRLDTHALHAALDAERRRRGLTWARLAAELPGFAVGMLTNLATAPLIGFPRVMVLTRWLGVPLASFVRGVDR